MEISGNREIYDFIIFENFVKNNLESAIYDKNKGRYENALKKLKCIEEKYPVIENGSFAKVISFLSCKLNVSKSIGNVYKHTQIDKALVYFNKSKEILLEIEKLVGDNEAYKTMKCDLMLNIGQCYRKMGELDKALCCYNDAQKEIEWFKVNGKLPDVNYEPNILKSIGNVYLDMKEYQQALSFYKRAEEKYQKMKETNIQFDVTPYMQLCASMSTCYREMGNDKMAKKYNDYMGMIELYKEDYYFADKETILEYVKKYKYNFLPDRKNSQHKWAYDIGSELFNSPILWLGEIYCPRFNRTGRLFDVFLKSPKSKIMDIVRFIDLELIRKRIDATTLTETQKEELIARYTEVQEDFLLVGIKINEQKYNNNIKEELENERKADYKNVDELEIIWNADQVNYGIINYIMRLYDRRTEYNKIKATFIYNGIQYSNMSVTDPDFFNITVEEPFCTDNAVVVMSIPDAPYEVNGENRYYKFVAKVFIV